MDIVSYRGPHAPGGVSNALQTVFYDPRIDLDGWWYVARNRFKRQNQFSSTAPLAASLPSDLVDAHYNYCNQYLWPLFHGFSHHAEYDAKLRLAYRRFNRLFAETISRADGGRELFIHDYQLAMLPKLLSAVNSSISFFWHIPWPANVPDAAVERISEIASGMAAATRIGFQTAKDASNFVRFCAKNLPDLEVEQKIVVAPVAIDHELWTMLSQDQLRSHQVMQRLGINPAETIVLSVERADYTKGVIERLNAIEHYLAVSQATAGNVRFVEVLPRTRAGVSAYDNYWKECWDKAQQINRLWGRGDWEPILWLEEPLGSIELAPLYARADVMLITSIADGLNLTAKEFIASQSGAPGALVLSRECGVVSELGEAAFVVDPRDAREVALAIRRALTCTPAELAMRVSVAHTAVVENDPRRWLSKMALPATARKFANVT